MFAWKQTYLQTFSVCCLTILMDLLNNYFFKGKLAYRHVGYLRPLGCSKKHALSFVEGFVQQGRSQFCARSVLPVREHGKLAPCLREATPAKGERRWRLFSTAR